MNRQKADRTAIAAHPNRIGAQTRRRLAPEENMAVSSFARARRATVMRTARRTATAVTSAISPNVGSAGTSFQSACAAKNVEKRTAIAAPSSAFAVTGYFRAAFSSQTTRSAIPARRPIAIRIGGFRSPLSIEYWRK